MTISPKTVVASRTARRLAVTCVHLACCAVESSAAIDMFLSDQQVMPTPSPDTEELHVLVVAGTVTHTNEQLVIEAFDALPQPRAVVAFGVCAISGGPYWDSYAVRQGIGGLVPVTVVVPGCPPAPRDLIDVLRELAEGQARHE